MKKIYLSLIFCATLFGASAQQMRNAGEAKTPEELVEILNHNAVVRKNLVDQKANTINYPRRFEDKKGGVREMVSVSETGMPIYYQTTNNIDAARTISTSRVWPSGGSGFSLTGQGMTNRLGVWDGGAVRLTHQEFQSRATQVDGATTLSDHATHVAGTMAAGGVVNNAKGMAYQSPIRCYDWNNDGTEMQQAASAGLLVSNHSYSQISGWNYNDNLNRWEFWADPNVSALEDHKYGYYDWTCQEFDQIAANNPNYLIFMAAGNDRGQPGTLPSVFYVRDNNGDWVQGNVNNRPPVTGPYDCISGGPANAKNVLTVGAVNRITNGWTKSSDVVMSSFSGWGPTDDGRIKPDVVANGVSVYSPISTGNTAYDTYNGTSMATPNASGSALLLQQHYNNLKGSFMRAATLKGLIIHTADEAGNNPGPDYTFGWGLMNTNKAALLLTDSSKNAVQQLTLNNGSTYTYSFYADGTTPIRVTISWTDRPANPLSASLDNPAKRLVNDLDVRLRRNADNAQFLPYILNPASPATAASTGDNNTDNVEMIHLGTPAAGLYTITVGHKGTLSGGPQAYSLIVSGIVPKPTASFSASSRTVCVNQNVNFTNLSVGGTSRVWYFPGGVPATTTVNNPSVSYPVPGYYPVALRISSSTGYDSIYITDYINVGGINLPLDETFEANSPTRGLWSVENVQNDSTWRLWNISGTSPGNTAMGINNYDVTTQFYTDRLVTPLLDLRGLSAASLQYQFAYTRYDNSATDSLIVLISTNCGQTYTRLAAYGENGSGSFATAPNNTFASVNAFIPNKAADWCGGGLGPSCGNIDLTPYVGNANVRIRFEQKTNNGGNNLFIDNVKVMGTTVAPKANFYLLNPSVCEGTEIQLMDSSLNNPAEWKWYVQDADTAIYTVRSPQVRFTSAGTKTISLVVKNSAGTDSIARVGYVTVAPAPQAPALTSTKGSAVCDGDSTVLATNASADYFWYKNNLLLPITQTSFTTKEEGLYYVRVKGANGCFSSSTQLNLAAATTPPKPTFLKDISGTTFCEGTAFNFSSSITTDNQWMVNDTLIPGANNRVLNANYPGEFKVRVNNKGCISTSDSLVISMLPRPNMSEISGRNWSAKGDTLRFTVTPGTSGSVINWTLTGGVIESGATTPEILVRFGNTNTAMINAQENGSNGCKSPLKTLPVSLVNTGIVSSSDFQLELYPNPVNEYINVLLPAFNSQSMVDVSITNVLGQTISQEKYNYKQQAIEISTIKLTPGVYILQVKVEGRVYSSRFVKE